MKNPNPPSKKKFHALSALLDTNTWLKFKSKALGICREGNCEEPCEPGRVRCMKHLVWHARNYRENRPFYFLGRKNPPYRPRFARVLGGAWTWVTR
jgi:hypothetical protein